MPTRRSLAGRFAAAAASVAVLAFAPAAHAVEGDAARRFARITHDYYERYLATHPETATQLGDHRFDRGVSDWSAAGAARDRRLYEGTLAALQRLPAAALSPDDAVDRDILIVDLRWRLFDLDEVKGWTWRTTDYNPTDGVYLLLARDYAPLRRRLLAANARLAAIPRLIEAAKANLRNPPRVFTETAIKQNKGAIAYVRDDLDAELVHEPSLRSVLAPARAKAVAALTAYGAWLEHDLLPRSNGDFRYGRARFEKQLHFSLDSDLSADRVLAEAEADADAIRKQMVDVARPLFAQFFPGESADALDGRVLVKRVLDRIAETHPTNETVVADAERDLAEATAFVREHRLVTIPDAPVRVIVMPEFRRGSATAYCDWAGPLDPKGETFYAISPTPADWTPERVQSQYREDNSAMLKDITVHEAMPGHYLQGATANRARHKSLVRSAAGSGTFAEGWGVYAEQIMAEAGYGGPETHMQQLKVRLRVAINAILDHRLHVDGIGEADAMRLMMVDGYQEEGEAAGKWRRAQMSAGQLSTYFVGVEEMNALARDIRAQTGAQPLTVHDAMLAHGTIATKYVRRLMALPPAVSLR